MSKLLLGGQMPQAPKPQGRQVREIDPTEQEQREAIAIALKEKEMSEHIGRKLMRHYPGYNWEVETSMLAGVVHVRCLDLNGIWGFDVHIKKIINDPDLRMVMLAGGEILERYYVSTGARRPGEVEDLARDLRGNAIGDHNNAAA